MKKKCANCGNEFEPREDHHKYCPDCISSHSGKQSSLSGLLLQSYYDALGNELKEVYIGIPEKLANLFATSNPALATKQLRDFFSMISRARKKAIIQRKMDAVKPILYQCLTHLNYQLERNVVPESFYKFMEHHLLLAEKDPESLEGFYHHLDSIVCYFPTRREKGGK